MMIKQQHITRLETQLAELVESTFVALFGNRIRAQDIALQLVREMESGAHRPDEPDAPPVAPDEYLIGLHPDVQSALIRRHPALSASLTGHLVELARSAGYHLPAEPRVVLLADASLAVNRFTVHTAHREREQQSSTATMQAVSIPKASATLSGAQLIIDDQLIVPLIAPVTNIGRHSDNQIVLSDPAVSRHHAQIRRRFDEHILFNARSKSGTFVNGVQIREHRLNSGDVIQLGDTQMVYMVDDNDDDEADDVDDATGPQDSFN